MIALAERAAALLTALRRLTLVPLLLRTALFVLAFTAFLLVFPGWALAGGYGLLLVAVALLPALTPRRGWTATLVVLTVVGGWILATSWYDERVVLWRLLTLAVLLYLHHSLTALAAVLPHDAVVPPEVVLRWLLRSLGVALAGAVAGILLLFLANLGGERTYFAAALLGLATAVGVAALLARLHRR
ncbi:hypothetical protein [Melissospora conviva]|uniref:hypothetical protein n=1 Tax=Melissospora conviva TaxID=3388432 RepID=UPI003C290E33